jgi:hypothetical protein
MHGSENVKFIKKKVKCNAGGPPYPQFQLSVVYCGLKKKFGKLKK